MSASLTPLGVNSSSSLLQNIGLWINPGVKTYLGTSKTNANYEMGTLVQNSCLRLLTYSINSAYTRSVDEGINAWYAVSQPGYWSSFMNTYGIWTNGKEDAPVTYNCNNMIDFPISGNYTFEVEVDDTVTVFLDGIFFFEGKMSEGKKTFTEHVSAGSHLLVLSVYNSGGPAGVAFAITSPLGNQIWNSRGAIPVSRSSWYNVTNPAWSSFMNSYAIWTGGASDVGTKLYSTTLTFNETGTYTFHVAADNIISVSIDQDVIINYTGFTGYTMITKYIVANKYALTLAVTNQGGPAGGAVQIIRPSGSELWNTRTPTPLLIDGPRVRNITYNNLVDIGNTTIPVLGNSPPSTYDYFDPSRKWSGQATTSYGLREDPYISQGQSQTAQWFPYNCTNWNKSVTQWGWLRCYALQAWNEFNYNGIPDGPEMPQYQDFTASFMTAHSFISQTNKNIKAFNDSQKFLQGTYSNMNDLISADITNITLATFRFGQDCINLGKSVDLSKIDKFGLPSVLLQTLQTYNGITQSLSLALLSTGMSVETIDNISKDTAAGISVSQEQQIYSAFLIIVGSDLEDILITLNCNTQGLESLADLLSVRMMFPTSFMTLTVPVYNTIETPTNSKTMYPIFANGGINNTLKNPAITSQVGTLIPTGTPTVVDEPVNEIISAPVSASTPAQTAIKNLQELPEGFDSYLRGILPEEIAIAAGAFSVTMQQIKNIKFVDFEKFSQVVGNIETIKGLPLINGTNIPTDLALAQQGQKLTALGTGPKGTYTMSDMLGCMSGLPYKWREISGLVTQLETRKLYNIYHELYLSVTWDQATISVQYYGYQVVTNPGPPPTYTTYYRLTGITVTSGGGGYGRGTAPPPQVLIFGPIGATAISSIGTDNIDLTTFGKVTQITVTSSGTDTTTIPTATIQCPPTATLPVNSDGSRNTTGTNTPTGTTGWNDPMDTVVQGYVTQANTEITDIRNKNEEASTKLNDLYNKTGTQLKLEQRTRYTALSAVPSPRDKNLNPYPNTTINFIDLIEVYSGETEPHMAAQTLEAISDLNTTGGQSLVGLMRQSRNQARLDLIGVPLDAEIPVTPTPKQQKATMASNNTSTGPEVQPLGAFDATGKFIVGNVINADPINIIDANGNFIGANAQTAGTQVPTNVADSVSTFQGAPVTIPGTEDVIVGISVDNPVAYNQGAPKVPGSLAGSPYSQFVPVPLNAAFTSGILSSGMNSIPEAIDTVILCNCDCWVH